MGTTLPGGVKGRSCGGGQSLGEEMFSGGCASCDIMKKKNLESALVVTQQKNCRGP